jgi:hypothetical protein
MDLLSSLSPPRKKFRKNIARFWTIHRTTRCDFPDHLPAPPFGRARPSARTSSWPAALPRWSAVAVNGHQRSSAASAP